MAHPKARYYKGLQGKNEEEKKAKEHKTRLRKNYFKALGREGERLPERKSKEERKEEEGAKPKRLSYQQRIKRSQEKKAERRKQQLDKTKEKVEYMHGKDRERRHFSKIYKNTTTRKGQPLMGPRINGLLERIQKDIDKKH